jgi:hypothetical protein
MKSKLFISLAILISGMLFFSCTKSVEKKLTGMWKVEDVKFDSSFPLDQEQIESSKAMAKTVRYELLEDKTARILVGSSVLEGNWIYKEAEARVFMVFTGSVDTVLLGRYEEGRMVNEESQSGIKITTIFTKEK